MNRSAYVWLAILVAQAMTIVAVRPGWLIVIAMQVGFVAVTAAMATYADFTEATRANDTTRLWRWAALLRMPQAIGVEVVSFFVMQCLMAFEPWLTRRWSAVTDTHARPVLLVHGVYCNRAVWWSLRRRLTRSGYGPIHAINLYPPAATIDSYVDAIIEGVRHLQAAETGARVVIVAHSMGGLAVRRAMRDPRFQPRDVECVVTIGTPHAGSIFARWCVSGACHDMRRGCSWLASLNAVQDPVRMLSILGVDDNLVAPRSSARLSGARCLPFTGLGHFALLWSRRVHSQLLDALRREAPFELEYNTARDNA